MKCLLCKTSNCLCLPSRSTLSPFVKPFESNCRIKYDAEMSTKLQHKNSNQKSYSESITRKNSSELSLTRSEQANWKFHQNETIDTNAVHASSSHQSKPVNIPKPFMAFQEYMSLHKSSNCATCSQRPPSEPTDLNQQVSQLKHL